MKAYILIIAALIVGISLSGCSKKQSSTTSTASKPVSVTSSSYDELPEIEFDSEPLNDKVSAITSVTSDSKAESNKDSVSSNTQNNTSNIPSTTISSQGDNKETSSVSAASSSPSSTTSSKEEKPQGGGNDPIELPFIPVK